jgi:hypothetical protein
MLAKEIKSGVTADCCTHQSGKILDGIAFDKHAVPDFAIQEQPEAIAMVGSPRMVFVKESINGWLRQDTVAS